MKKFVPLLLVVLLAVFFAACSDNDDKIAVLTARNAELQGQADILAGRLGEVEGDLATVKADLATAREEAHANLVSSGLSEAQEIANLRADFDQKVGDLTQQVAFNSPRTDCDALGGYDHYGCGIDPWSAYLSFETAAERALHNGDEELARALILSGLSNLGTFCSRHVMRQEYVPQELRDLVSDYFFFNASETEKDHVEISLNTGGC